MQNKYVSCLAGIGLLLQLYVSGYAQPEQGISISSFDTAGLMQDIDRARTLRVIPGKAAEAKTILYKTLERSRISGYGRAERNALLMLVQICYSEGDYNQALQLTDALEKASPVTNQDGRLYAHYFRALAFHMSGRHKEAFKSYTETLRFHMLAPAMKADILNNMADILFQQNQDAKARHYFEEAIALAKQRKDYAMLVTGYTNISRIPARNNDYAAAKAYLDSSIAIVRQHPVAAHLVMTVYLRQADFFNRFDMPDSALAAAKQARKYHTARKEGKRSTGHQIPMFAGDAYLLKGDYKKAEQAFMTALDEIDSVHNKTDLLYTLHKLSNIFEKTNQYRKAYYAHLNSHNIVEEVKSNEKLLKIQELEARYSTSEKDKEIARKNLRLSQSQKSIAQKNLLIISISACAVILLLLSIGIYLAYRRRQKIMHEQMKTEVLKGIMQGEEKERRRLAGELHDGIGGMIAAIKMNMSALNAVALPSDVHKKLEDIHIMLEDTHTEVRTSAHNLMPDVLNRYHLQDALVQLIDKLNKVSAATIHLHTPYPLTPLGKTAELLLYRILQEALQNALKHAEATLIEIQLLEYNGYLTITIEDNGKGMPDQLQAPGGIGFKNISWRIQSLKGTLGVESRPGAYTIVRIVLELQKLLFLKEE